MSSAMTMMRNLSLGLMMAAGVAMMAMPALAADQTKKPAKASDNRYLSVPMNRSTLVVLDRPMSEVMVANPEIADIHAHNAMNLTVVAKKLGRTNVRVFDKEGKLLREFDVTVTHDLPAIRRALKNFLPDETIGVEMVNTSIAITGQISNATVAEKAVKIVQDFIRTDSSTASKESVSKGPDEVTEYPDILNLLQVVSGQQVQLRVRVGEVNREALKRLGLDLNYITDTTGTGIRLGTGTGIEAITAGSTGGVFSFTGNPQDTYRGIMTGVWQPDGRNGKALGGLVKALEQEGLFKLLAEPNLVAISGEEAEFLAGGEIPIPVVQGTNTTSGNVSIEYKPFGVAVKFTPYVLSENRIRMTVQPEVSEISTQNAIVTSGFSIPSITTRRAKTTIELAPGESYMIAGLIKDQTRAQIDQIPGAKELPVLGALFRSTEFQRNESELVIAVTPYVVDPVKSSDMKLPTDSFRPADQMEMFFYGAVGALTGAQKINDEALEGPVGFMVD